MAATRKIGARRPAASTRPKRSAVAAAARPPASPATAHAHRGTREDHAHETAEDYVEAIAALITETGEARVTDLARQLGVSHVTVNRTIARLQREGLVTSLPYRAIFLTDQGRTVADQSRRRHEIVLAFLRTLGVSEPIARRDAEGIEHHVSPETLAAMERQLKR